MQLGVGNMKPAFLAIAGICLAVLPARAEVFTINDALSHTIKTNPGVGEAAANRRATESELRQTQSTLLPQVRIEASYGPEKFDQSRGFITPNVLAAPVVGAGVRRESAPVQPPTAQNATQATHRIESVMTAQALHPELYLPHQCRALSLTPHIVLSKR